MGDGEKNAESRAAGLGFKVDQPALGGDELGDEGKAKSGALGFCRHKRVEETFS